MLHEKAIPFSSNCRPPSTITAPNQFTISRVMMNESITQERERDKYKSHSSKFADGASKACVTQGKYTGRKPIPIG